MEKTFALHLAVIQSALAAADPKRLLLSRVTRRGSELCLGDGRLSLEGPGLVVALGKAAGPMLEGARTLLGDLQCEWLCVTKDLHPMLTPDLVLTSVSPVQAKGATLEPSPEMDSSVKHWNDGQKGRVDSRGGGNEGYFFASHPVPDERSVLAAEAILQRAKKLSETPNAWFLLLLSGGASSLACAPVEGVTLREKQALFRALLSSGLEISDCNVVRGALSRFKAGGLLRALGDTRAACVVLSDVIAGDLSTVGSGPLSPPSTETGRSSVLMAQQDAARRIPSPANALPSAGSGRHLSLPGLSLGIKPCSGASPSRLPLYPTEKNAKAILIKSGLWPKVSASIRAALERSPALEAARAHVPHFLLADRRDLLAGAIRELEARGYRVVSQDDSFSGSAEQLISRFSSAIGGLAPKSAMIVVGEPTLAVTGSGKGGRAQHIALCMARVISGDDALSFIACGSDGTDGPTDAAGAIVDGDSWARYIEAGVDPDEALQGFDSYRAHSAAGTILRLGPTGTNVNDLYILVRD